MKKTRALYETYLNQIGPPPGDGSWIIGGKNRYYSTRGRYGYAVRVYDPIQFEIGFNEWSGWKQWTAGIGVE